MIKTSYSLANTTKKKHESSQLKRMLFLYRYFRKYGGLLLLSLVLLLLTSLASIGLLYFFKVLIDDNLAKGDYSGLISTVIGIGVVSVLRSVTSYGRIHVVGLIGQKALFELRKDIFDHLQELPLQFFTENKSGDIIARVTNDVEYVNRFLSEGFIQLLEVFFNLIAVGIVVFLLDIALTQLAFVGVIFLVVFLFVQGTFLRKSTRRSLDENGSLSSSIQEMLGGFRVMKGFAQEGLIAERFIEVNARYKKASLLQASIDALSSPGLELITRLSILSILIVGVQRVIGGVMTLGILVSYWAYIYQFFQQVTSLSSISSNIQSGLAATARIQELLAMQTNIFTSGDPYLPKYEEIKGKVEFDHVHFSYEDGVEVLSDVAMLAKPGKKIAVVGPTGGGKTSFVGLIARLYDVDKGLVLIDDVDVREWDLETIRYAVSYVLQDTFLFADTIVNNLRYGKPDATLEEMEGVLRLLGVWDFIDALPEKLETVLEQNGENLSLGQRQMLSIARTFLSDPKIVVLDEATANIDTRSEQMIIQAMDTLMQGRTSFVIAHRLSTVENADHIVFIHESRILEQGSHEELMSRDGKFSEMYRKYREAG
ncbi:MAG: ABC transporter ATP-binding protein [bacterium]